MKTKSGFVLRPLGREFVLIMEDVKAVNFNRMISLNESAAYLWESIDGKDFDVQTLADLLTDRYEVDAETALKDSRAIADKWLEAGIIEQ